jgi:hypothetical protein
MAGASLAGRFAVALARRGLDIAVPFPVQRYNDAMRDLGKHEWVLRDGGHASESIYALVCG